MLLVACQPAADQGEPRNGSPSDNSAMVIPTLPVTDPALDREALLIAAARAASAYAAGQDDTSLQRSFDGDQFELRIRFGCPKGMREPRPDRAFGVDYDADSRTLRVRAAPDVASDQPVVAALAGESIEAVEGFWIERPWLLTAACPAVPQQPEPPGVDQTRQPAGTGVDGLALAARVGIAQFFTAADPRTRRRGKRAYETAKALVSGEQPSPVGYNLVLAGRLRKRADERVIGCTGNRADAPPTCIISVEFGRVRIERADTVEVLAEWGGG